ncbi:MAG: chromate transporter [Clostridiales bacterium]|nr:chromate transporter [Clostridiales bacterium]
MKNKIKQNEIPDESSPKRVSLWQLFATFFKTGLFTFGGGYAMISILEEELVANKKWITTQDMLDMLVIAESTPGVIAVNTATSVGFKLRGVLGAIVATLGVVLPSFLIITALTFVINEFSSNPWYQAAFTGIQACVMILIINAFVKLAKQIEKTWFSIVLLIAAFAVAVFTNFDVIFIILIGGVLGVAYTLIKERINAKKSRELPLAESERLDGDGQGRDEGGGEQ